MELLLIFDQIRGVILCLLTFTSVVFAECAAFTLQYKVLKLKLNLSLIEFEITYGIFYIFCLVLQRDSAQSGCEVHCFIDKAF